MRRDGNLRACNRRKANGLQLLLPLCPRCNPHRRTPPPPPQLYARFLEDVRGNLPLARHYVMEAEKVEAEAGMEAMGEEGQGAGDAARAGRAIDEARDGVVVADGDGLVTFVNATAARQFGHRASEMLGHNVAALMPPPFAQQHDRFVKAYAVTGEPRILNATRTMVGLHRDRSLFPISICVTKVAQVCRL